MRPFTRRHFLVAAGASTVAAMFPHAVRGQAARPHVVVVGGGFGGATAAKYLRHWGAGAVDVTLVDSRPNHPSCILSNLVLNDQVTLRSITFGFDGLSSRFGVRVVRDRVDRIEPDLRQVRLASGEHVRYDRLVLSPGITFDRVPGLDSRLVPHAWKAGGQTHLLRRQLAALPSGGTFVMSIPPAPYRCPPGPYERACVVADYLRREKGGGQVIVLDANPQIIAERHTFTTAFEQTYAGIIDYRPDTSVVEVDSAGRALHTAAGEVVRGDVANVIPAQRAPGLLRRAGLVNDASRRWAGVDPLGYESTAHPGIHVIGDAQATGQPKAGHIANAEAKICADAILRAFEGLPPDPEPVTNSACYSPITSDTASWLTAAFRYDAATGAMKVVPESSGEAESPTRENYRDMFGWANNLFADTFGLS